MPTTGGSFEQCYNAQAAVDTQTMLIVIPFVTQATNDKQQMEPALNKLTALPQVFGTACIVHTIEPLLAVQRESHHMPIFDRFAPNAPAPETENAVMRMAHR